MGRLLGSALGREFPVTKLLIGLCTVVFLLSTVGKGPFPLWISDGIRVSESVRWGALMVGVGVLEPWRYLSAVFVHGNALHLLLNMLALLSLGRAAERGLGWARFTVAFVGTGVLGYLVSHGWFALWGSAGRLVGASGAIFGLLGLEVGLLLARRAPEARSRLLSAVAFAVVIGLAIPVNNSAHLGGLGAGVLTGYLFVRERGRLTRHRYFYWVAALLLAACVGSVLLSASSPLWRAARQYEIARGLD